MIKDVGDSEVRQSKINS